ncbi:MAG: hypothetical protein ACREUP_07550, partial [Burkholderiales bacterium]
MLESVAHTFWDLHFQYVEQFLVALLPMAVTVAIHGEGMQLAGRHFNRHGRRPAAGSSAGPHVIVLITIVAIMLAAHFSEVFAWAFFYLATDMISDFRTAMFYSVESYTTLGASNFDLPGRWQGLGGLEAMTAMLMFGWSTAVLAVILQKSHGIEA